MGLFSKQEKWTKYEAYYIINDSLYKYSTRYPELEHNRPIVELYDKYGFWVAKYDFEFDAFADWSAEYFKTLDECPYNINAAEGIEQPDLVKAISKTKKAFEKKFKDFPLDGTLYSHNDMDEYEECFPPVVKPRKKLVNEGSVSITRFILEVEMLDGKHTETRREFIPFARFIRDYKPGCAVKVIESDEQYEYGDCTKWFEDYFDL